ncbi:putative 2OG-Fe(II) oxygenase [Novosphingobium sp.]|uniref:putative 2OG-Fe(II) oxygenase n=1 Tax=Novosphingobium sp. TaxID=1874826 RepID=UPI0025EBBEBF|nr:putative 2OG-Fe(II) oxygenase [Novosphingobium sp.]
MDADRKQVSGALARELDGLQRAPDQTRHDALLALCRRALSLGLAAQAIPLLDALGGADPANAEVALLRGVALRREQRFADAAAVFAGARGAGATDPALLQGLAQTRYELGQPAAALFAQALQSCPGNMELLRNRALALASEGQQAKAESLLEAELARNPDWLDGHRALSTLRWTGADQARFAESYAAAMPRIPHNAALWQAWFSALAQVRDWAGATDVLDRWEASLGSSPATQVSRLFVASEAGDAATTHRLLAATQRVSGAAIDLIRVRHALRARDARGAEAICLAQVATSAAALFWPYLSLAWRLALDQRHLWLDNPDALIGVHRVDLAADELTDLADLLRSLHTMQRPYAEQSVRGGTQTDRSVIQRDEPIMRLAKARFLDTVRAYVDGLPPNDPQHPLLSLPRGHLLIEGSWSVRLLRQGYNVPHNHPVGWISTAFYIALPDAGQMGPPPCGHIALGTPPEELGLDLRAYRTIAPEPGLAALFPSTMWHRTMPFDDGERLVIALDVARPRT